MDMLILDQTHMGYSQSQQTSSFNTSAVYLHDFRSEPCQVCGENASGWHCGSITCEACKKFFLRSVNEEYRKYKCIRDKKCIITRTTRTQCQYCRYMKCIEVGMKLSEGSPNPKIEDIFKQIPCAVCQNPSSGIHFGATTCEGCKGFFRRTIKERTPQRYKCPEKNNCEVNLSTRSACRACRFQKCLTAGMSIEGSRIGRQSNLFKHKMVEMQRRGLIRSQLRHIIATNSNNHHLNSSNHSRKKIINDNQSTSILRLEDKMEGHVFRQILEIENAYINYLKDLPFCLNEINDLWGACASQLNEYTIRVGDFALKIPDFCNLNLEDKNLLIPSIANSKLNEIEKIEKIQEEMFCILYDYMSVKRGTHNKDYFILTVQIPLLHRINSIISTNIVNFKCSLSYNTSM